MDPMTFEARTVGRSIDLNCLAGDSEICSHHHGRGRLHQALVCP